MFEATLKNRISAHFAPVTITFPIPEDQYEQAILALEKSQIGDARVQDCLIDNVRAVNCPALVRMTGTMANVDELDWLGKQLESFDRYELLQFSAAVERFGLSAADELIDLSFCAREVTVVSDFTDLEKTGKRHYLTVHGACDPKELENLDGKETALALISGQPGYVTRYGVVYDNGIKLEQAYDRKHLPPIWMAENRILELKIRATGEDDPKKQEWVQLPARRMKLERAMLRAGIPSCGEMQILFSGSRFPDAVDCALDFEQESLFELNRLCHACSNFKEQNFVKLGAVCQMAKPTCAANIRQLAENLDQFDFAPNARTPEELGRYMIQRSGYYEYDENLEDFYNYGDYGVKRMLQEDGVFVDRGYVSYHGTLTLDELMRDDPAENHQQEQETHAEGMAKKRVVFYCDEFGTMPPFDVLPLFSAGRSRKLTLVPIIQSLAQLEKNYGKEGAEIIADNCQDTIFGGFAPNSQTAETLSKALGSRTVLTGSISKGKDSNSQSLQMAERALLSPDELKSLPKGEFVVMKTGTHPMRTKLQLYFKWGIKFEEPYQTPERAQREVYYAGKEELLMNIQRSLAAQRAPVKVAKGDYMSSYEGA